MLPSDTAGTNTRTHNSRCTSALFPSQTIQSLYTNKHVTDSHTFPQHTAAATCIKMVFIENRDSLLTAEHCV